MSEEVQKQILEERKVKALETIATSLNDLVLWFEEVDKTTWGDRIEWYLDLVKTKFLSDSKDSGEDA